MPTKIPTHRQPRLPGPPRPSASKRGYDKNWQKLRALKLFTDPICAHCGKLVDHTGRPGQVDHSDGDVWNRAWENLESLCDSCHSKKTVREQGGFGKKKISGGSL